MLMFTRDTILVDGSMVIVEKRLLHARVHLITYDKSYGVVILLCYFYHGVRRLPFDQRVYFCESGRTCNLNIVGETQGI